jgi:hypothetical protein
MAEKRKKEELKDSESVKDETTGKPKRFVSK